MKLWCLAVVAVALAGCGGTPEPKFANGKTEIENRVDAQIAVESQLRDPKSAQWGAIVVRDKGDATVVCGMVNAKNAFGGYVGERPFIYEGGVAEVMDAERFKAFERRFVERCSA